MGNKKTDPAVKSVLELSCAEAGVPYNDFKHCFSQYILSNWNGAVANKLHSVNPVLGDWQASYRRCRKDGIVLCGARIGHTHLTHSFILKKDPHLRLSNVSVFSGGVQSFCSRKEIYIWKKRCGRII